MGDKKRLLYFGEPPRVLLGFFRGVCNFLGSILSQQKFEGKDIKALSSSQLSDRLSHSFQTDCVSALRQTVSALGKISVTALGQISVTVPFYLENKGKYIFKM